MMSDTLPQPTEAFAWAQAPAGPVLVCRPLERVARHVFTSRQWSLGLRADDRAWAEVSQAMDIAPAALVRVRQVHGTAVLARRADEPRSPGQGLGSAARPEADIAISNDPQLALAIQTADCVPLLIADRRTGAVAAAHAGRRGLAARVPIIAVDALGREFGSRPADLLAAAGPSIGVCCYEVGEEVRAEFEQMGFGNDELARWFVREPRPTVRNPLMPSHALPGASRAGRWYFDGWAATCEQLESTGIVRAQIFMADLCTASHAGMFCSYRRDGKAAGRMAAAIRSAPPGPLPRLPADPRAR